MVVGIVAGVAAGSAAATIGVYPDSASGLEGTNLINATPALVAMYGRVWDPTSIAALSVIKTISMGTAMLAVVAAFVVIRHTPADEELGRHEQLFAAGSVGRYAPLTAGLVVSSMTMTVGAVSAMALTATGLPAAGSAAFGLDWAVVGLTFAGVRAVAAQLTRSASSARGLAVWLVASAFIARAVGDTMNSDRMDGAADAFLGVELSFVAVYRIDAAQRIPTEEASHRAELFVSAPISRT